MHDLLSRRDRQGVGADHRQSDEKTRRHGHAVRTSVRPGSAWACGLFGALLALRTGEDARLRVGEKAISGDVLLLANY
jgi:hypothetical protein